MPRDRITSLCLSLVLMSASVAVAATGTIGCLQMSSAGSHVRAGDLYAPGLHRYDEYFAAVHSQQATAAQWAGDRKTAHQALVASLKLDDDATDAAIGEAAHAKATPTHAVQAAIEQTVHADTERAKGLDAVITKIDELVKTGHDLEAHVSADFDKPGTGGTSPSDVNKELNASFEVLVGIRDQAKREAKAAEDLLLSLQHGAPDSHPARHAAAAPRTTTASPSLPAPSPGPTSPPKPQPKPEPGEVFQP